MTQHALDTATVQHMATLSRLSVNEEEQALFAQQFTDILGYMEVLQGIDTTGVEPLYSPVLHEGNLREDCCTQKHTRDTILANAPEQNDGHFVVPRIV